MIRAYGADAKALRRAFSEFPCGVAALAADVGGEPSVLIVSSFTVGVSQDPPMVMFAVQRSSTTWPTLAKARRIGVSILGEGHGDLVQQLSSKDKSVRLVGVATRRTASGAIFFPGSPIWMECSIAHTYPAGDHDIVVLELSGLESNFAYRPLVWHRSGFVRLAS